MKHLYSYKILKFHFLKTSLSQFPSSLFPDARVGSCYDNSLPFNGGLTGTPPSSQMVPVKSSGIFVFLNGQGGVLYFFMITELDLLSG